MTHGVVPSSLATGARGVIAPLARGLAAAGVSANAVTVAGLVVTCAGATLLALGQPLVAGMVLLVGTACDALDGQVARASGGGTRAGAFLDSTLDRLADAVLAIAIVWIGFVGADSILILAGFTTLVASQLVSYVRAKAEALGVTAQRGPAPREARVGLYLLGVFLWAFTGDVRLLQGALLIIAILAVLTCIERVTHVIETLRKEGN